MNFTRRAQFITLRDAFRTRYHLPVFQRSYSWEKPQVLFLLEDLIATFGERNGPRTALGPLMTFRDSDNRDNIFDGQQRMTTLLLLFMAIRDKYREHENLKRYVDVVIYTNEFSGENAKNNFQLIPKRKTVHELITWIYHNPGASMKDVNAKAVEIYRNANADLFEQAENRRARIQNTEIGRVADAYKTCWEWLDENFQRNAEQCEKFVSHIYNDAEFQHTETFSIDDAMHQYERANHSVSVLTAFDLLKNTVFSHTPEDKFESVDRIWSHMTDLIERSKTKPDAMMRLAYISGMPHSQFENASTKRARDWFREREQASIIKKDPEKFSNSLLRLWQIDERLEQCLDPWGNFSQPISNILALRSNLSAFRPAIFAANEAPQHIFSRLMSVLETIALVFHITSDDAKDVSNLMIAFTSDISKIRDEHDFDYFIQNRVAPILRKKRATLRRDLNHLREFSSANATKLILAKIAAHFEAGFQDARKTESELMREFDSFEIEHIMPRNGLKNSKDETSPIFAFGNLTLLEKTLNASIQNSPFSEKVEAYGRSSSRLTRQLAQSQSYGQNTLFSEAAAGAPSFSRWDERAIEERQEHYSDMIIAAWHIDDPEHFLFEKQAMLAA